MKQLTEEQALARAAAQCSTSEQCVSQIRQKLVRWNIDEEAQERILTHLVEERYIDEARFARAYANDKFRYNHWGSVRIDMELRRLGIASSLRREAVDGLPQEELTDTLKALLAHKAPGIKAKSAYERNAKLIRFALGRGFQMNDILRVLPQDVENIDE